MRSELSEYLKGNLDLFNVLLIAQLQFVLLSEFLYLCTSLQKEIQLLSYPPSIFVHQHMQEWPGVSMDRRGSLYKN